MKERKEMSVVRVGIVLVLLFVGSMSVSAQYYVNFWKTDGTRIEYPVSDIDKVSITGTKLPAFKAEYVDLGLSVKWATCNMGSVLPTGYGMYYAWGELQDKTENPIYKWYDNSTRKYTKYVFVEYMGSIDMKYRLDPQDDAAYKLGGSEWRIPTSDEMQELIDSCNWIWADSNGVNGYIVKSKKNENSIFLPAAGRFYDGAAEPQERNIAGYYMTNTVNTLSNDGCYRLSLYAAGFGMTYDRRSNGYSVRPVYSSVFGDNVVNAVNLSLEEVDIRIETGQQYQLVADYKLDKEKVEINPSWTSSDPSVARVSNLGVVVGVSAGTCNITVRIGSTARTCRVTVKQSEVVMNAVDLGLSVKWASCNIGASQEDFVGGYYAWGETDKNTTYSLDSYKWIASDSTYIKYCSDPHMGYDGFTDNLTTLTATDDVAQMLWGGDWRMPTNDELYELIDNCDIVPVERNGHHVFKFISKINGDSIFLPANGTIEDDLYTTGAIGAYWTSSANSKDTRQADASFFVGAETFMLAWPNSSMNEYPLFRHIGVGIRPVMRNADEVAKDSLNDVYLSFSRNITGSAGIYVPLRAMFNYMGDDVAIAGTAIDDQFDQKALDLFLYADSNIVVSDAYNRFYNTIIEANKLIAHFESGYNGGDPTKITRKAVAEARVLRAYLHMMLAIGWGTPPLLDFVPDESTVLYNCDSDPRGAKTHKQLLEWCAQECLAAVADLDERESTQDKEGAYKVTKGFAYAVAGKAYLLAGDYADSKTALGKVISSKKYALVPGRRYWENFHVEGDGNEEKIFEPNFEYDPSVSQWSETMPVFRSTWMESNVFSWRTNSFVTAPHKVYTGNPDGWGGLAVPEEFANEFFENEGHSSRFDASLIRVDDAIYNMTYDIADIDAMNSEQKKTSGRVGIKEGGLYGQSFYLPKKMLQRVSDVTPSWQNNIRVNNYTIMRYAEVLLLYAEACLLTDDYDGAKDAINMIQERAGAPISATVDMDVLKKEKKYELWLEGSRWVDLVRWGDTDGVKQAGQKVNTIYDKMTREPQQGETVTWLPGENASTGRFYIVTTNEAVTFFEDPVGFKEKKNELFPYPKAVLEANPNITQNTGWK